MLWCLIEFHFDSMQLYHSSLNQWTFSKLSSQWIITPLLKTNTSLIPVKRTHMTMNAVTYSIIPIIVSLQHDFN